MEAASRYRIVRSIGRGGMAEVFEGVLVGDTGFQRRVALKCLLHEHANVEWYAKAFIDEARIGSQLHHGNIVAVVDFGTMDDLPFQVLELVDGLERAQTAERNGGAQAIVRAELADLVEQIPGATLHTWYDGLPEGYPLTEPDRSGRIDLSAIDFPVETNVYICGPAAFMEEAVRQLGAIGVPRERIWFEAFSPLAV